MSVLPACMSVYHVHACVHTGHQKRSNLLGLDLHLVKTPCGCWEPESSESPTCSTEHHYGSVEVYVFRSVEQRNSANKEKVIPL